MPDYLSVAIHVTGDDSSFLATIAKDTALLKTFAKQDPKVLLGADGAPLTSDLATASGELNSWSKSQVNKKIGIDTLQMQRNIFAANETLSAWAGVAIVKDIDLDIKTAAAMASLDATIASLKAEALLNPITVPIKTDGAGLAVGAGLAAAVAKFFTIKGIGGIAGAGGILGAGLHLAGLSVAHLAVAGLDLAGSAVAGLAGGLLKGIAGAGVMAVGMGTDMAGIGQAAGDIKLINSDTQALDQAVAIYGKNSYQAADAQKQLNYDLSSFAAVARGPVQKAVAALAQFKALFDKFTGPAEAKGANLITQGIKVAEAFLPIIGKFASINMTKITAGLQPLFKWLDSPAKGGGLQIFTELEKIFTAHLPTGISAFVNGFESLVKVIGMVAPKTGGFMKSLNDFFIKLNTQLNNPKSKDSTTIDNLLKSWNAWYTFVKTLSTDFYRLFSGGKDQKTGLSMIQQLTGYLQQFGKLEKSVTGTKDITVLFSASKKELTALLSLLPPLAKAFGALITLVVPGMHLGMTTAIKGLVDLLNGLASLITKVSKFPAIGKIVGELAGLGGAALGIGLIATKLHILTPIINGFLKVLSAAGLSKVPVIGSLLTKAQGPGTTTAFSTSVTEFSAAVTRFVGGAAAGAGEAGVAAKGASKLGSTIGTLAVTSLVVYGAFEAKAPVTAAVNKVSSTLFGTVSTSAQAQAGYNASIKAAQGNAAKIAIINQEATTAAKAFGFTIVEVSTQTAKKTTAAYTKAGSDAAAGFTTGITSGKANAGKASSDIGLNALNSLKTTLKAKSPSQEMAIIGGDAALGFAQGMTSSSSLAKFRTAGTDIADAIAEGIKRGESAITVALQQVVTKAINQALQQSSKASLTAVRAGAGTVF